MSGRIEARQSRYSVSREAMATHLVEDRRASVSPWGRGNSKIGPGVYTYSKPAGRGYSCPGSTDYCEEACYAKRMVQNPALAWLYAENAARGDELPQLPADAELVRGHVSGDFDTVDYVDSWTSLALRRPQVLFWFYTRSWRVPELRQALEALRALPNVQVWASLDPDCDLPPEGWRCAWLDGDPRLTRVGVESNAYRIRGFPRRIPACPEETGERANCVECGYCFSQGTGDLVFLEHRPK